MKAVGAHKKLFGLFLATLTVLVIMGVFLQLAIQDREANHWVTHTYEVQARLETTLLDVETGQDAYEDYWLNRNPGALNAYTGSFQRAFADLNTLEQLVSDNVEQSIQLRSLRHDITVFRMALDIAIKGPVPPSGALILVREFRLLERVHRSADSMKQAEQDLLVQRNQTNRASQLRVNIALTCFLIVVSLLIVSLFNSARKEIVQQQAAERLRHASDQKVANILENISDAFMALNRAWMITYMNGQAEQVIGRPRTDLIGRSFWTLYPEAEGTEIDLHYRRAMQEQVTVHFETYVPRSARWYELHAYPNEDGLGIFFQNITERKLADEERERLAKQELLHAAAQRRNQELRNLARRLVEMQEAERCHLAHELHEEVGQVLAGLKLSLASVLKQQDAARENQLRIAQDLVTEAMRQVRALSLDLRPGVLDDLGLLPALEWYCKHYTEQTEALVDLTMVGLDVRIDGTVETTAYRIVQEALANVAQYSGVKTVAVRLTLRDEWLELQISDRGVGLTLENVHCFCDHSSLTGMQERATLIGGTFEVTTGPNQRTILLARLPIHPIYTSLNPDRNRSVIVEDLDS